MRVRLQNQHSTVVERLGVFWTGMANGMANRMAQGQAPINSRPRPRALGETPETGITVSADVVAPLMTTCRGFAGKLAAL